MTSGDQWGTSVNKIIHIFRDALLALIPIADRARILWREPDNYDDWDLIAQSLFRSIVVMSLENADECKALQGTPKYDERISDYSLKSFLSTSKGSGELAFICFETDSLPFDTALLARLDEAGRVLRLERQDVGQLHFLLSGRSKDSIVEIDRISVNL